MKSCGCRHRRLRFACVRSNECRNRGLVGSLVYQFPALQALLEEHVDDQEGEILPHLFMADLERRELGLLGLAAWTASVGRMRMANDTCPVCGFPHLTEPPWDDAVPSDEICPSC